MFFFATKFYLKKIIYVFQKLIQKFYFDQFTKFKRKTKTYFLQFIKKHFRMIKNNYNVFVINNKTSCIFN